MTQRSRHLSESASRLPLLMLFYLCLGVVFSWLWVVFTWLYDLIHVKHWLWLDRLSYGLFGFVLLPSACGAKAVIIKAVESRDDATVKELLQQIWWWWGFSFEKYDVVRDATIHAAGGAPGGGHVGSLRVLLKECREGVYAAGWPRYTALHVAAQRGSPDQCDIVAELLSGCIELVNSFDRDGFTALMLAVLESNIAVVEMLVQCSEVDVNATNTKIGGMTALHIAAHCNCLPAVQLLLRCSRVKVNFSDANGATPLITAARRGNVDIVKELIKCSQVVANAFDKDGWTALHVAAASPLITAAQEGGEDIKLKCSQVAAREYCPVVDELLKCARVNVDASTKGNASALTIAAGNGQSDIVHRLCKCSRLEINKSFPSALMAAAENGHSSCVMELFRTMEARSYYGSEVSSIEVQQANLQAWAYALAKATQHGHYDVVRALVTPPGRLRPGNYGEHVRAALEVAEQQPHLDVAYLLRTQIC